MENSSDITDMKKKRNSHPLKNGAFYGAPDKARYVALARLV